MQIFDLLFSEKIETSETMDKKETYQPEWINEQDACSWLGVDKSTLYRWRAQHGLAYTNINGRTVCYDRKQITELLNKNSTYAITGNKKLTA